MAIVQEDRISEISNQFRQGDTKELSKYLSTSVTLSLMNSENVYSRAQCEIILDKFFKEYPPQSSKVVHRLDNNSNYQHAVFLLNTTKGDFRVAISLRGAEKDLRLIEIRIEKSN
jgi:hypothetical protein